MGHVRPRRRRVHPLTLLPGGPIVAVVGDVALDVRATHRAPLAPGGDTPATVRTSPGGSAANTARALAPYGATPVLVGRVGDDTTGRELATGLAADGVCCALTVDPLARTGCVVVLVDAAGDRTMLPDRGANAALEPADVVLPPGAAHLHLSGYVLLDPRSRPAGLAALAAARDAGLSTSVDPASAPLLRAVGAEAALGWLRGVDLLLPNAEELAALGPVVHQVVGAVAVTVGADGARWIGPDAQHHVAQHHVAQHHVAQHHVAAEPVAPGTDSTGAGDAFDGGLLAAWLGGASPADALRAGVRAAADRLS